MARRLYCPECGTEYWGDAKGAVCGECEHIFTAYEIWKALNNNQDCNKDNYVNTQS